MALEPKARSKQAKENLSKKFLILNEIQAPSYLEGATTLSIMAFGIMTLGIADLFATLSGNDIQHYRVPSCR